MNFPKRKNVSDFNRTFVRFFGIEFRDAHRVGLSGNPVGLTRSGFGFGSGRVGVFQLSGFPIKNSVK